ncbi:MAG: energy-coupling factor transporter transmembrane protein EcfT [Actinobacteria bacterium]|nr:energy-coupling factor transporter transmembrane protein EcfT [Actinomycetota bacterium]
MLTSTYQPGTSLLHRSGAGVKLLGLLVFSTVLVAWQSPVTVLVGFVLVVGLYAVGGFGVRTLVSQVWPLRWIVLFLIPFQWWTAGWQVAVGVVGTLVVAVVGAALISLTTRVTDLLDVIARLLEPARAIGVDPDRVALLLALTIRAVPVIAGTLQEARDARRARGLERSTRALVTPIVVRTIRHADRVGDALAARGIDD